MKVVHTIVLFAALTGAATCLFFKYMIRVSGDFNWTDAQQYCRNNYVDLLSVTKQEEDFIHFPPPLANTIFWIGLSKKPEETNFTQWSDESAVGYTNWGSGQPDGPTYQHCVATYQDAWHDDSCWNMHSFICYKWEPRLIVVQEMKTWEEALKHCRTFYTDLISLTTLTDLYFINISSKNVQTPSFWTGLRFVDGSWFWVNDEDLGNFVSLPSCPLRPFRCGAQRTGTDIFENRDCEEKMNFICYELDT